MNARFNEVRTTRHSDAPASVALAASRAAPVASLRHVHRDRDFGIGYGNSSGYGREHHYTRDGFAPLFRCA